MTKALIAMALFGASAFAGLTSITDTLRRPNGVVFVGTLSISLNYPDRAQPLRNSAGDTLVGFRRDLAVTDGTVSVQLEANDAITPGGTSYQVRYVPVAGSGATWTETWIVPTSGSALKVHELRSTTVPLPSVMLPASQITGGAVTGSATGQVTIQAPGAGSTLLTVAAGGSDTTKSVLAAIGGRIKLAATTPTTSGETCTTATITVDADYIYVCTASNTWKRVALAGF